MEAEEGYAPRFPAAGAPTQVRGFLSKAAGREGGTALESRRRRHSEDLKGEETP